MANKYRFMSGIVYLEIIFQQDWWEKERTERCSIQKRPNGFETNGIAFHKLVGFEGGIKKHKTSIGYIMFFCHKVTLADDHFETGGPLTVIL